MISHHTNDIFDEDSHDISARLQKMMPTQTQDKVAMFIFFLTLPAMYAFVFFNVLPTWYPVFGEAWVIRVVPLLFLAFNVYHNYFYVVKTGPNGNNTVLPSTYQAGFKFCHSCNTNAPPRAYHCPVCDVCVFRRDHHCSFAAVCIGHFNQRYFVSAVCNLLILNAVCLVWTWEWMWLSLGPFTLGRIWQLIMPHVAWMLGFLANSQFGCVGFTAMLITVFVFTIYLMTAQCFVMFKGQTRVEYLMDVHAYHLGLVSNIKQCLGSRWFLVFLSPLIPSPLPSNGLSYQTRDIQQHHATKSM